MLRNLFGLKKAKTEQLELDFESQQMVECQEKLRALRIMSDPEIVGEMSGIVERFNDLWDEMRKRNPKIKPWVNWQEKELLLIESGANIGRIIAPHDYVVDEDEDDMGGFDPRQEFGSVNYGGY